MKGIFIYLSYIIIYSRHLYIFTKTPLIHKNYMIWRKKK